MNEGELGGARVEGNTHAVAIKAPMRRAPNVAGTSTILPRDDQEVDAR